MPNNKTHNIINISIFIPVLILLITSPVVGWLNTTIFSVLYLFSCFMFNGDLDIESAPYYRWGALKLIWIPYRKLIPHRSILSHGIFIGTILRLLYISPLLLIIYHFIGDYVTTKMMIYGLLGLELGNTVHTISDITFSKIRKIIK